MTKADQLILNDRQVSQKITRIAYEIYESNFSSKKLFIVGIHPQGYHFAQLLVEELKTIAHFGLELVKIEIDKENLLGSEVQFDCDTATFKNRTVILVDDVLNTGRVLAYSLKSLLAIGLKKLEVAVLVNRKHSLFPITATYTGYELATTINEHVEVVLSKKKKGVYLLD